MVGKEWTSLVMVMNIDRMVIIHDGDCDGSNEGESPTRVGKELTAQNVAVQGETGARIASSSASASTVVFATLLCSVLMWFLRCHLSPCFWKLLLYSRLHRASL